MGFEQVNGLLASPWQQWGLSQHPFCSPEPFELHRSHFSFFFAAVVVCIVRFVLFLLPRASVTTL